MMTPPLFRWTLRKIVTMSSSAGIPLYGGPVGRQFMQYEHHPVKNPRTISIKDQRRTVEDIRIGKLRGRGAPLRIPHQTGNPKRIK